MHSFWVSTHTCPAASSSSDSCVPNLLPPPPGAVHFSLCPVCLAISLSTPALYPAVQNTFFPPTGKSISRNTCVLMLRNAAGSAWIKHQMWESQKLDCAKSVNSTWRPACLLCLTWDALICFLSSPRVSCYGTTGCCSLLLNRPI